MHALPTATYPGNRATFALESKYWGVNPGGEDCKLRGQYCFVSSTQGSFISRVNLLGYENGTIALSVAAGFQNSENFTSFLRNNGLVNGMRTDYCYIATTPNAIQHLFTILIANNDFPATELEFLREKIIAATGKVLGGI